jgi:hypothetical protein
MRKIGFLSKGRTYDAEHICADTGWIWDKCTGAEYAAWAMHAGDWLVWELSHAPQVLSRPGDGQRWRGIYDRNSRFWTIVEWARDDVARSTPEKTNWQAWAKAMMQLAVDVRADAVARGLSDPDFVAVPYEWGDDQVHMVPGPMDSGFWADMLKKIREFLSDAAKDVGGVASHIGALVGVVAVLFLLSKSRGLLR